MNCAAPLTARDEPLGGEPLGLELVAERLVAERLSRVGGVWGGGIAGKLFSYKRIGI